MRVKSIIQRRICAFYCNGQKEKYCVIVCCLFLVLLVWFKVLFSSKYTIALFSASSLSISAKRGRLLDFKFPTLQYINWILCPGELQANTWRDEGKLGTEAEAQFAWLIECCRALTTAVGCHCMGQHKQDNNDYCKCDLCSEDKKYRYL